MKPTTIQMIPIQRLYGWVANIIDHIVATATNPMIALIGSSCPLIIRFQPSLKGRGRSGLLILKLRREAWANMKASSEPKAYRAPMFSKTLAAKNPGVKMRSATMLNRIIET